MALVPQAGLVIAARYRLLHRVGLGGMADVWAAADVSDERMVALKLVRGGSGDDEAARLSLLREARAAQALRHPHVLEIPEVLDVGGPILGMDLLGGAPLRVRALREGEPLAARLRHPPALTVGVVVATALPVVSALGAAHAAGLVHRDLKPANVFLVSRASGEPFVRVLDFGIARRTVIDSHTAVSSGLTTTGLIIGTPAYMSPEQLYGETDLDHRADLWSPGVVLYQCLTGILPTEGDNLGQVIKAIVARPFHPVALLRPEVPPPLSDLVSRLLSREREHRPSDAREVFDVLRALDPNFAKDIPVPPRLPAPAHASSGSNAIAPRPSRSLLAMPRRRRIAFACAALLTVTAIAFQQRWFH